MIEFINKVTGTKMWVAENRVEEYTAAGHIPAADFVVKKPAKKAPVKKGNKEMR